MNKDDKYSDDLLAPDMNSTQVQSQAVPVEGLDPFNQSTDNQLAQRSSSISSDNALLGEQAFQNKVGGRDSSISEDLLELNTEEQEQFEVLDSADGEDDKSQGIACS